jgi:hypothetical protein
LLCDINKPKKQAFWLNLLGFIKYPILIANVSQFSYFLHYSGEKHNFNKQTINIKTCVHGCALRNLPVPDQIQLQINVSIVENKENI